ncbi:hydroxymethylpyrimidine/phosphomethylpyrimidine kinase [Corynebacterium mycetoides]|uniref:Thiamine biosynthesis multifunctional protein ThiED n=1 Tax=Corynebacterium mycetoides TaxID=38302 RepID=A0A1G9QFS9_9CORY|nr:bifunctional hydroxymethylpyrimidine kinase/phosphomethylpyrimidine kinase [Corynebacterium mycetoides]SDM09869.1 hydroxymethylpyrimidine/phosphomethylpyrimidine kinase [Corynebacterium mycetoides]
MTSQQPRVLSIAGTDPTGGAGIQADLKSIAAAGGYGMAVVTALVAQNTRGVREVHNPPQEFLTAQLDAVFDDVRVDAVKIGMLGDPATTATVSSFLAQHPVPVVVVDPVMVATSGDRLLSSDAEDALRQLIRDHATMLTPNIPELAVLTGSAPAPDFDAAVAQGASFATDTGVSVLVKGGHLTGAHASNALVTPAGEVHVIEVPRVDTPNTHGTGCSLSSALATRLLIDASPNAAAEWASHWLHEAIRNADALHVGGGHGPVDHFHALRRRASAGSTRPWAETDRWHERSTDQQTLLPSIAPAGEHTRRLWEMAARLVWPQILGLGFVQDLRDGTLARDDFDFYLAQDAHYLGDYSRALSSLSAKAPTADDQVWWAHTAQQAIVAEQELHRTWFRDHGTDAESSPTSPVTLGYVSFLKAQVALEDYPVGVAAVLPCFWLYAEVGLYLAGSNSPEHAYRAWLDTYSGDEYVNEARGAIARAEEALAAATQAQRRQAADAFMHACYYERDFFDQASRR